MGVDQARTMLDTKRRAVLRSLATGREERRGRQGGGSSRDGGGVCGARARTLEPAPGLQDRVLGVVVLADVDAVHLAPAQPLHASSTRLHPLTPSERSGEGAPGCSRTSLRARPPRPRPRTAASRAPSAPHVLRSARRVVMHFEDFEALQCITKFRVFAERRLLPSPGSSAPSNGAECGEQREGAPPGRPGERGCSPSASARRRSQRSSAGRPASPRSRTPPVSVRKGTP
eukprot:SAG11_NODE_1716_length_4394_cov_4.474738_4_plen_230_part_00